MKLGTETASVVNWMMSGMTVGAPSPEVGMGCTVLKWTDRQAATIIKVTPKTLTVQYDHAKRVDKNGMSECQQYEYSRNPEGCTRVFRLTNRGWRETGGGSSLLVGQRNHYHDFSF